MRYCTLCERSELHVLELAQLFCNMWTSEREREALGAQRLLPGSPAKPVANINRVQDYGEACVFCEIWDN